MIRPPLVVCPYCEGGTYAYAGKVVAKVCSACREAIDGPTGADRKAERRREFMEAAERAGSPGASVMAVPAGETDEERTWRVMCDALRNEDS